MERLTRAEFREVIRHFLRGRDLDDWRWNRGIELYHRTQFRLPEGCAAAIVGHVQVLNEHREMAGLRAVVLEPHLCQAATYHCGVMADANRLFHEGGPDGTPDERATRFGYGGGVTENCAVSGPDAEGPYWGWVSSQGHHRNMLGEGHTVVGVGYARNYWTQMFGNAGVPAAARACVQRIR